MATTVPYSGGLGLMMYGTNPPTGHVGLSNSLYLRSNITSGNLPLFAKNTPTNSGILKAQTNWDVSLLSAPRLNGSIGGSFTYQKNDFSSNKYDGYYGVNRGNTPVQYTIDGEWQIDDVAVEDGVMVVGTKDWTSFEKITKDATNLGIYSPYISEIFWYQVPGPTMQTVTIYDFQIRWTTHTTPCLITNPGTLIVNYTYGGSPQTFTGSVGLNQSLTTPNIYSDSWPPTLSFTGSPSSWVDSSCVEIILNSTSSQSIPVYPTLPNGAVVIGNRYFLTSDIKPKLSNFIIPELSSVFQDPDRKWMDQNSPNFEVPDYSDIYLDIIFDSAIVNPGNSQLLNPVVSSSTERKVYSFGGFYTQSQFYNMLQDKDYIQVKTSIDGESSYLWYIVTKDDGTYSTVMLSDYVTWDYVYNINFPLNESTFLDDSHIIVGWKQPSIKSITATKVVSYPNCGKVDLYFYKSGTIESFTSSSNIIKSSNHGLKTGDCIKITECLSTSKTLLTNLNGIFYIKVIDGNNFAIYSDSGFVYPINVVNTKTGSGKWNSINGEVWGYNSTIFSPYGKNGYGYTPALRQVVQTAPTSDDPFERAVDGNVYDSGPQPPQADFTGQRSWSNFYPFERFNTTDFTAYGIVNGNKFGASLAIKKYNSGYVLMVTEPGAFESFEICESFILNQGETLPQNRVVIPNYFPYGRIHFYQIDSNKNVTYLTSCSSTDNPWAAYEFTNRQERLLGVNAPYQNSKLTFNNIKAYNTTSSNYWNGARFCAWQQSYTYNSTYNTNLPDQNSSPLEYGFADCLGKAADFEVDGTNIYCFASTNVKSADYLNNLRVLNFDAYAKTFSFSISSPATKTISDIVVDNSTDTNNNVTAQKEEINLFGERIVINNGKVLVGWPTKFREQEYIYAYDRSGSDYNLAQIISSDTSRGFGSYFDYDNNLLVANKYYYVDDNSIPTTNPLQSIESYRYDRVSDTFHYTGKITPTIDLSNPIYAGINPDQYEQTTNLSYDNTAANSATYIIDLSRMFAVKNDTLVIRDWNEYAVFQYNYGEDKFKVKTHRFAPVNTNTALIKLSKSLGSSFFDTRTEWDTGQSSQGLNIFDASRGIDSSLTNYIITTDTQYLNGLNLYVKTIEGYSSGNLQLSTHGLAYSSGNASLYVQPPMPLATGLNLFAKQVDILNTGVSLFHKSTSLSSGNVDLFLRNGFVSEGLALSFHPFYKEVFPLYVQNKPTTYFKDVYGDLFLSSYITSTPNISGTYNLFLQSIPSDDYASTFSLLINNNNTLASSGITLYQNAGATGSGSTFNNTQLYIGSSGNQVYNFTDTFNLLIKCPEVAQIPLFVYNSMMTGNLNMSVSGANYRGSGITLFSSGVDYPNQSMNITIRGDL